MRFKIENNRLSLGDNFIEFKDEIEEVLDFGSSLVVRTKQFKSTTLENVYGVNEQGEKMWQVPEMSRIVYQEMKFVGITHPYIGLTKIDDKRVKLHNWDGTTFEVDATSGELLTNPIQSRIGRRPW